MGFDATVSPASGQTVVSEAAHQQFVFAYRLLQRGENAHAAEAFDEYLNKFPRDEKRNDAVYFRAILYHRAGDDARAIKLFADIGPTKLVADHAVNLLKGQIYNDNKQHDLALKSLEQIDTRTLKPQLRASVMYLCGQAYRGAGNLAAAEKQFDEASSFESPLRVQAKLDQARTLVGLNRRGDAIKALTDAVAMRDPNVSPEAARLAGDLAFESAAYEQATGFYNEVLTSYSSSRHMAPSIIGLMWAQLRQGKQGELLATFKQYRDSLPSDDRITAWYLAGSAEYDLGRHENAVRLFEEILVGASGSKIEDRVLYRLAASQFELKQYPAMSVTIARLRTSHPKSDRMPDAEFLEALAASRQGNDSGAASQLTAIIRQGPKHPYFAQSLVQRANIYEANDKLEPAAQDYERYLQLAFGDDSEDRSRVEQASLRLIDILYQLEAYEKAGEHAARLLNMPKLNPAAEAEAQYRLGLARVKLEEYEPALKSLTTLIESHPQSPHLDNARYYRGLLLLTLKRPDDGLKDLAAVADSERLSDSLKINALRLTAVRQLEKGEAAQAAAGYKRIEGLSGLSGLRANELLVVADFEHRESRYRETLRYLQPVLKGSAGASESTRAEALLLAAKALRDLKQLEPAIQAFREVVAIGRGYGQRARLELAEALYANDEAEEALAEYAGLMSDKESLVAAKAAYRSGEIYRDLYVARLRVDDKQGAGDAMKMAENGFLRVVLLYGDFPEVAPLPQLSLLQQAELDEIADQSDAAAAHYNELIEKYPDGPFAVYARGMLNFRNPSVAMQLFRRVQETAKVDARLMQRIDRRIRELEAK